MPPTTTIANTSPATKNSRLANARGRFTERCGARGQRERLNSSADAYARATSRAASRRITSMLYCNSRHVRVYQAHAHDSACDSDPRLDRMAMALSGLCLVHCVATAVLLALLSAAGGLLGSPIIHEVGLTFAMGAGRRRARPRHPRTWLHDAERGRRARPWRHGRGAQPSAWWASRQSTRSSACDPGARPPPQRYGRRLGVCRLPGQRRRTIFACPWPATTTSFTKAIR